MAIGLPLLASGGQMNDSVVVDAEASVSPDDRPYDPVRAPLMHASAAARKDDT